MDSLVRLSPDEAKSALESISVADAGKETLNGATIIGELKQDELGTRVTLKLSWSDRKNANPVELSAWLREPETAGDSQ